MWFQSAEIQPITVIVIKKKKRKESTVAEQEEKKRVLQPTWKISSPSPSRVKNSSPRERHAFLSRSSLSNFDTSTNLTLSQSTPVQRIKFSDSSNTPEKSYSNLQQTFSATTTNNATPNINNHTTISPQLQPQGSRQIQFATTLPPVKDKSNRKSVVILDKQISGSKKANNYRLSTNSTTSYIAVGGEKIFQRSKSTFLKHVRRDPNEMQEKCCSNCFAEFKLNLRRHRCGKCGFSYCGECASNKVLPFVLLSIPTAYINKQQDNNTKLLMNNKLVRLCNDCFSKVKHTIPQVSILVKRLGYIPSNSYKLILIGDSGSGKSAIASKLSNRFYKNKPTLGVATSTLDVLVDVNSNISLKLPLHIWDISGSDRYQVCFESWTQDVTICIITYDITRKDALINLKRWISLTRKFDRCNSIVALIGTKSDLESKRMISHQDASSFAKTQAIDFFMEVSNVGDNNYRIDFFKTLITQIIVRHVRKDDIVSGNLVNDEFSEELTISMKIDPSIINY